MAFGMMCVFNLQLCFICIITCSHLAFVSPCVVEGGKYDLTPLSRFLWNITIQRNTHLVEYKLSLCSPLRISDSCANSSICLIENNGSNSKTSNLGNYEEILKTDKDADDEGFWLKFKGASCPEGGTFRSLINLQCAESLGSPKLIGVYGCNTYLLWETFVACTRDMKRKEVPCYTHDFLGRKYDLSPLIQPKGGYLIKSQDEAVSFYINVCSDILTDFWTVGCPRGAGACRKIGNDSLSFGEVRDPLIRNTTGNLQLVYYHEGEQVPPECYTHPRTTITFICPINGLDKLPVIVSNSNCHYQVEWSVVNACPIRQLESKDGCTLTSNVDGIRIDLSLLTVSKPNIPHHAQGIIDGKIFDFYFGLCGEIKPNYSCGNIPSSLTRVCRKRIDDYKGVIVGTGLNQTLRYSDNRVILSFGGGDLCQRNDSAGALYSTVIIFECGSDGIDGPQFIHEEDCVAFFKWKMQFACIELKKANDCYARNGENIFDFTSLTKVHGEGAWKAIAESQSKHGLSQIYINVCDSVPSYTDTAGCPFGSAVCVKDVNGKMHDFGQYSSQPTFNPDTGDVLLHYISSEACSMYGNTTRNSIIRFVCQPGVTNLGPRLLHASDDGCFLEFEWQSTTACAQAAIVGSNCQIKHPSLGFIDLTPLMSPTYYNVSTDKYSFYLNICSNLKGAPCLLKDADIAACQSDYKNTSKMWTLGKVSHKLMYYNGIVNITFADGTPYNDQKRTPRQTVIVFLCDWNAGIGSPVFVEEENGVYSFKWTTVYVCPPRTVPCIYIDELMQTQYDLSRLTRNPGQDDWEIEDLHGSRKFYLNVCRRLTHADIGDGKCDSLAGICATSLENGMERTFIANIGKAEFSPHIKDGQLFLNYTSGQPCSGGSEGQNYSAIIYFVCTDDPILKNSNAAKGLKFVREAHCQYMFEWNTPAACPLLNAEVSDGCAVRDPNTAFTYSFDSIPPLLHVSVKSSVEFESFEISICGNLNSSACGDRLLGDSFPIAACGRLRNERKSVVLGLSNSRRLKVAKDGSVSVHFHGPLSNSTAQPMYRLEIIFLCHRNLEASNPTFSHQEGEVFIFEYKSAITCPPQEVECTYHNSQGSIYDLSTLSYSSGHWEVHDPRHGKQNTVFYLNVCRSVKVSSDSNCSLGAVGACKFDSSTGKTWSLGHVQSRPQMSANGQNTITLKYLNGDLCDYGKWYRSTIIYFTCSTKQDGPRFIEETEQCEYIFSWETPAACPVKQSLGKNCQVSDPVYNNIFDFNRLSNSSGYSVNSGNKTFKLNVCAPLNFDCGGNKEAGVCVQTSDGIVSSGNFSNRLIYDHGEITLTFEGEHLILMISFLCDYSTTGKQGPMLVSGLHDNGFYFLTWNTSYACRSFKDSTCSAFGPNNTLYDLSRLTLLSSNHEYITDDGKYKYLINVCHSVIHGKDAQCHYGTGVCEVNISEANLEKKFSSIGEVGNGPYVENGVLKLVYDMGELCQIRNISLLHKKAIIEFYCSPFIDEGSPLFLSSVNCEYRFAWYTSVACPVLQEDTVGGDCTTINPNTGYKFDLSILRNTSYIVESVEYRFTLGVCEGAPSNPCGTNVGSCQKVLTGNSSYYNAGVANSKLHYRNGVLLLNYTNWEPCPHLSGSNVWATVISFVCGKDKLSPEFVGLNGCLYLFEWHTDLACEKQIHCTVEVDNEIFDLSHIGDHIAFSSNENDSATYLLNVCRPINPHHNSMCPPEAAACQINYSTNMAYSLGHAEKPPSVDAQGHIILEYVRGSPCPTNVRLNASTRIIFKCNNRLVSGMLQLVEVTPECTYVFEWPTYVVCHSVTHGYVSSNCSYFDSRTQRNFDLTRLYAVSTDKHMVEIRRGVFTIDLCGTVAKEGPCAEAGICLKVDGIQESWGALTTRRFSYDSQILKVVYRGHPCPSWESVSRFSSIVFICDLNAGSGKPELIQKSECEAIFTWKTSLVCTKQEIQCDLVHDREYYNLRLLSSYSHSWTVDVSVTEKFWINICGNLGGHDDPRCPTDSAVCWKTSSGKVMSIGAAENQQLYMADDGHTILLRYSTPTNVCFHGPNNSGLPTWSEIQFKCSPRAKNLKFVSRGTKFNNCTFTFEWKTPFACSGRIVKTTIEERNGKLENGLLGLYLDLSSLLASNVTAVEKRGQDTYLYYFDLLGLSNHKNGQCDGAAICQVKSNDSFQRSIGNVSKKKFYLQGSELIIILQSTSQCGRNAERNATSHIVLQCSLSAGMGQPEFVYESFDCNYIFNWQTSATCDPVLLHSLDVVPVEVYQDSSHVGIAVGVTCLVIAIAIALFVIFRKKGRRICAFLSGGSLSTISSSLSSSNRQGSSSISFARLTEEEANS